VRSIVLTRILQLIIILFAVSTLLFFLLHLSGDPAALLLGPVSTEEAYQKARSDLGLDRPLHVQYWDFLKDLVRLNFGRSIIRPVEAIDIVLEALPRTIMVGLTAATIAILLGLPMGILAAVRRGSFISFAVILVSLLGQSAPSFFISVMLILVFSVQLHLLPSFGYGSPAHLIMPALALSGRLMAQVARLIRSEMLEVLSREYILTARGKGLAERIVIGRHALLNALIPAITIIGLELGRLLAGSMIVETIFVWPGVGKLLVDAVLRRDFPVVQASVFVIAILITMTNLVVDLLYLALDPRLRSPRSS
jgi:ABC-type dipeptide/oligopeptide/nickel transport system permease component